MSYFKKFGDFCSGFCAFMALIYLFRQFMSYDFDKSEELGMSDKLKMFFSKAVEPDNLMLLWLAVFCIFSVVVGRIAVRLPYLSLPVTVPPLLLAVDMIRLEFIKEYPMLYVLLCGISIVSAVYDCIIMDREDEGHRCAVGTNLVSLLAALFCFIVNLRYNGMSDADVATLSRFDYEIFSNSPSMDMKIFLIFSIIFAASAVIGFLLSDIYFIHGILSVPIAISLIYLWSAQKISVHAEIIVTLGIINFVVRAIPAISASAGKVKKAKT